MTKTKIKWGAIDGLLLLVGLMPVIAAILWYDRLPESIAVHFGISGEPNGYQNKATFLWFAGLLTLGLPLFMKLTRYIDPKRENYEKFEGAFEAVRIALSLLMAGVVGFILAYNLGYQVNIQMFVLLTVGLLYVITGNYMGQFRFNYLIGIKTPWTLADPEVWRRTHRFAAPVWVVAGIVAVICAFLPGIIAVWIFGTAIAVSVILPMVYSYVQFRRIRK